MHNGPKQSTGPVVHIAFYSNVYGGLFLREQSNWCVNLTTHLYLAPRSRMSGNESPRSHVPYIFMYFTFSLFNLKIQSFLEKQTP